MAEDLIRELDSVDADRREAAAGYLGDLLESGRASPADSKSAIDALVAAAVREPVAAVRDEILNALLLSGSNPAIESALLEPLLGLLGRVGDDATDAILTTLGYSRRAEYRPVLLRFTSDPNPSIREAAAMALAELEGKEGGPR